MRQLIIFVCWVNANAKNSFDGVNEKHSESGAAVVFSSPQPHQKRSSTVSGSSLAAVAPGFELMLRNTLCISDFRTSYEDTSLAQQHNYTVHDIITTNATCK